MGCSGARRSNGVVYPRKFMQKTIALPNAPVKLVQEEGEPFSDDAFVEFCRANPDVRVERTAEGEIVIAPPAGAESSNRSLKVAAQLGRWSEEDGRGEAFDSSAEFMLSDGSALSPDASWVSNTALRRLTREQRKQFLRLCPEFVVEVMSPSDRLGKAKAKMEQWIANGAQLGWLIDGDRKTVYVYRSTQALETHRGIRELAGEGPVEGFVLKLASIWKGLG
jgi:Uma2 family endonuclease